jgi:hypothetical protein
VLAPWSNPLHCPPTAGSSSISRIADWQLCRTASHKEAFGGPRGGAQGKPSGSPPRRRMIRRSSANSYVGVCWGRTGGDNLWSVSNRDRKSCPFAIWST